MSETFIKLEVQPLHAGQRGIKDDPAQVKVVRWGRRGGKTELGVRESVETASRGGAVGWFAPESKYSFEARERLIDVFGMVENGGLITSSNQQTGMIYLVTGGSIEIWTMRDKEDAGRSRAYDLVVIDEAGLVPDLDRRWDKAIEPTILDRKGRAYILGTSKVSGVGFRRLFQRAATEPEWKQFRGKTLDNPHLHPTARLKVERARVRAVMAGRLADWEAEYEGGDADDGGTFFPASMIERLIAQCPDPRFRANIDLPMQYMPDRDHWLASSRRDLGRVQVRSDEMGEWEFFIDLVPDRRGRMRPPQNRPWCFGIDVGNGVGANPTIISAGDAETGTKVAVYRSTRVTPPEAARRAAIAGHWFGGVLGQAQVLYEANGPGEMFGQTLVQVSYPGIARRTEFGSKTHEDEKDAYGWWSSPKAKESLLIAYRESLTGGDFYNPSKRGLSECLPYRYDEHGRVVTDNAMDGTHGDEAIADALLKACMATVPGIKAQIEIPPVGSDEWDDLMRDKKKYAGSGW